MRVEIDQSGKIEQTNHDTVIALSNDIKFTLVLPKQAKRNLQRLFRYTKHYRSYPFIIFSACVAILLSLVKVNSKITIDREYTGHDEFIKQHIDEYLSLLNVPAKPHIVFDFIGKSSNAHELASQVLYKKVTANITLRERTILDLVKKTGNLLRPRSA